MSGADKIINIGDVISKKDLELIVEVNKQAIEIRSEVADQNEDIMKELEDIKEDQKRIEEQLKEVSKQCGEMNKDLFKIQVFFAAGILSTIAQVITIVITLLRK